MATSRLDVIIFGASGFTGKYTVFEAISVLKDLRWGIAGRSRQKLENVLQTMGEKASQDLSHIPIILADIDDEKSLAAMARQCQVLVNCCGPYRFYGEPVVKACIEAKTHHVDVSGEPQYMETMQLKYNTLAEENQVYVISACGFDSIPADMGVVFVEKNFDGVVNSVETYLESYTKGSASRGGAAIHYGTWESAIYGLAHADELRGIRSQLFNGRLPIFQPMLHHRFPTFYSNIVDGICLPFPGSDRSVVMRSQRFLYEKNEKRPVQMHAYVAFKSRMAAYGVAMVAIIFSVLAKFRLGRYLLLKYPGFFSGGFISHEGPSEAKMEHTYFSLTIRALGWPKRTDHHSNVSNTARLTFNEPPSKSLMVRITGPNPGYGATCVALLCSALMILREKDKMPGKGGVLPPGAAFARTSLISELEKHEHGMKFEILANK